MNKIAWIGIVAALLVVVGVWYVNSASETPEVDVDVDAPAEVDAPEVEDNSETGDEDETTDPTEAESDVKEFEVVGTNFEYDVEEMRVNEGDTVRITFRSEGGVHDWVLDEFGAQTEILQAGEEETIEFVAGEAGEYEYYCSVGQHRQMGMVGTLIVE